MKSELKPKKLHGTVYRYNHGCRCEECKLAVSVYLKAYRSLDSTSKNIAHGTYSSYTAGCRCDSCTQANTDHCRDYYKRKLKKTA